MTLSGNMSGAWSRSLWTRNCINLPTSCKLAPDRVSGPTPPSDIRSCSAAVFASAKGSLLLFVQAKLEKQLRDHPLVGTCGRRKTDITRSVFVHPALQQYGKRFIPKLNTPHLHGDDRKNSDWQAFQTTVCISDNCINMYEQHICQHDSVSMYAMHCSSHVKEDDAK